MGKQQQVNSSLDGYRVLDLTESGCMIGARILGELGADIIKIEPPGGSASRIAPFYKETPDPEKSLYWFAYNLNKRGITLDITKPEGRKIFLRLVETADVLIESFDTGYLTRLGIGYEQLCEVKADIIVTSITPFGQEGPKSHYRGSDLCAWASGGFLNLCGDPDQPPVWISFPQASLHAGVEAASGTMAALWYRQMTNEGQQVDVSMQECVCAINFNAPESWDLNRMEFSRSSTHLNIGAHGVKATQVWRCKDGYEFLIPQAGAEPFLGSTKRLVGWMSEEGMASDWLKEMNWADDYSAATLTQDKVDQVETAFAKFLMTKTKVELFEEGALKRRIFTAPISNIKDLNENRQLTSRNFWTSVEHPELGECLTYCGPFIRMSQSPLMNCHRAPQIGEHNNEIYTQELGITTETLQQLKQEQII